MDRDAFDGLTKVLAMSPSRRQALGALLAGLAATIGAADAKKHRRKGKSAITAQSTCASPGPRSNLARCNFDGQDLSDDNLAGSNLVGASFLNANLAETSLSNSNAKSADFRGADLCGANLRSSQLKNADFRGFANPDRPTVLYKADLSHSSCGGAQFNDRSLYCGTTLCNGSVSNRDCPGGLSAADLCCNCDGPTKFCDRGTCRICDVCDTGCPFTTIQAAIGEAAVGATLVVCPGSYGGGVITIAKDLTIIGAGSGAGGTILSGSGDGDTGAHVQVVENRAVTLRDLDISGRNNVNSFGGGMRVFRNAEVTLTRVRVSGNRARQGGGIANEGDLTLEAGTTITGNTADSGGGVYNLGNVHAQSGSTISGNAPNNCVNVGPGTGCP